MIDAGVTEGFWEGACQMAGAWPQEAEAITRACVVCRQGKMPTLMSLGPWQNVAIDSLVDKCVI